MSVYPMEKTPNTQPNTVSLMPSSKDMSLLAEEMQTRSNMVKNAREHRHATTWLRREGPFVFIEVSRTGLEARVCRLYPRGQLRICCNRFLRYCQARNC